VSAKRLFWVLVLLVGAGAAAGLFVLRSSSASPSVAAPAATWAAGERPAPAFTLRDENGHAVSLAAYRGAPVLVTFMDPVCPDYCPLEAKVLNDALAHAPVSVVAVSVNLAANGRKTLLHAAAKWQWGANWRWAVGSAGELRPVWSRYGIAVLQTKREVVHTEAAYLVDASGHERALFLWPFTAQSVADAIRSLR